MQGARKLGAQEFELAFWPTAKEPEGEHWCPDNKAAGQMRRARRGVGRREEPKGPAGSPDE